MYISNFLGGGTILQGEAGLSAINQNDLVLENQLGQIFSAQVTDYASVGGAGGIIVPTVTVQSSPVSATGRKYVFINPADGSLFMGACTAASNSGLEIFKYSSGGALLGGVVVSVQLNSIAGSCCIAQLSNGNLAITWSENTNGNFFAIIDTTLDIIVARTAFGAASSAAGVMDIVSLSAGGFAISYAQGTGVFLVIYTNAGSVTYAATLIASSPTANLATKIAQLSSGNIAVAITSTTASKTIGHAIFSITGSSVLAYTALNTNTAVSGGVNQIGLDILALSGTYCVASYDNTPEITAYVCNNSGTVQGSAFTNASAASSVNPIKLMTDGTNFWLAFAGTSAAIYAYLPPTGTGYVVSAPGTGTLTYGDVFYDRGFIVAADVTSTNILSVYQITVTNGLDKVNTVTLPTMATSSSAYVVLRPTGDFSAALVVSDVNTLNYFQFAIGKYLSTTLLGVSMAALGAGNAGSAVTISTASGLAPTNQIIGTTPKSFGSAGGNNGVMYGAVTFLNGINGNRRNIN